MFGRRKERTEEILEIVNADPRDISLHEQFEQEPVMEGLRFEWNRQTKSWMLRPIPGGVFDEIREEYAEKDPRVKQWKRRGRWL